MVRKNNNVNKVFCNMHRQYLFYFAVISNLILFSFKWRNYSIYTLEKFENFMDVIQNEFISENW